MREKSRMINASKSRETHANRNVGFASVHVSVSWQNSTVLCSLR
jgi:hypothetical protein